MCPYFMFRVVCSSDIMKCVRRSELYAMAAGQVEYRFRQRIVGVALLLLSSASTDARCYGAIVVSDAICCYLIQYCGVYIDD